MGLFSRLFGKKNKDKKLEHKTDSEALGLKEYTEVAAKSKAETVLDKHMAKKSQEKRKTEAAASIQSATGKAKVESATKATTPKTRSVSTAEEMAADKISEDKTTKSVKMKGYSGAFDIKKSKDGRYVFNLYAANRVIVATSQIYSSVQSALTGIKSVIANAQRANVEDQTLKSFQPQPFPKWEIYIDKGNQFRWRLLATNGNCVLHSQGYTQKSACKNGIESVIRTAKDAQIDKSYLKKEQ